MKSSIDGGALEGAWNKDTCTPSLIPLSHERPMLSVTDEDELGFIQRIDFVMIYVCHMSKLN